VHEPVGETHVSPPQRQQFAEPQPVKAATVNMAPSCAFSAAALSSETSAASSTWKSPERR
jgi:hypothetical protein